MSHSFATYQSILRFLADGKKYKPGVIASQVGIARATANKYLRILLNEGKIIKEGKAPHIWYILSDPIYIPDNTDMKVYYDHEFSYYETQIFDHNFLKYDVDGSVLKGTQGFIHRCKQRNIDIYTAGENYITLYTTLKNLENTCGLLDASDEFTKHVDTMALDKLYYTGQYKWNEFGRSKLAEQAFYAKQMQDKELLHDVCEQIVGKITCMIKMYSIDALAFTPPSIRRTTQILDVLDSYLQHVDLPRVHVVKDYPTKIITPQKSLRKREDRVRNARNTIYVNDPNVSTYRHVLLIDDFVGSGATLNETAKKLKHAGVVQVTGCAIVGNLDISYEVINEM